MNHFERIENEWQERVRACFALTEIGFTRSREKDLGENLKEVWFSSKNFIYVVGRHLGRDENYSRYLDSKNQEEIPSPQTALVYFSSDIEGLINRLQQPKSDKEIVKLMIDLYRENPWLIDCVHWMHDHNLLDAIEKANQWAWSLNRMPQMWEFEKHLNSLRDATTPLPCCKPS